MTTKTEKWQKLETKWQQGQKNWSQIDIRQLKIDTELPQFDNSVKNVLTAFKTSLIKIVS